MPLQSSGPIKMSEIKAFLGSSSNSLRVYSAAAKAATGDAKFDTPDSLSEFYSYAGATTTTTSTTTTTTTTLPPITFVSVVGSCIMYEGSGRIVITVSGGSGQYQYSIDNGVNFTSTTTNTTQTFNNLNDGNYDIKVKSVTDDIIYTYSSNPIVINCLPVLGGSFTNSCDSNGVGTIFITATGGSGNYSYRIRRTSDNTDTTSGFSVFTGLDSFGTYNVYITDTTYSNEIYIGQVTFNCTTTTTTTTLPPLSIANSGVTCFGNVGSFTSTISGGSGTYSRIVIATSQANASNAVVNGPYNSVSSNPYSWSNISNGTWYVAVMDSNGTVSVQNTGVVVNCTTTTTTTTTTTAAPTTTTTTISGGPIQ